MIAETRAHDSPKQQQGLRREEKEMEHSVADEKVMMESGISSSSKPRKGGLRTMPFIIGTPSSHSFMNLCYNLKCRIIPVSFCLNYVLLFLLVIDLFVF